MQEQTSQTFKPSLSLFDATMLVAGSMIGSGIFIVSADIVRNVGSAGWLILVWLISGIMTIIAAISYGELSSMFPKAGGQYVYLKEAYNPLIGFLYGWSFFSVIQTATIAAVGVAFSKFLAYLVPQLGNTYQLFDLGFIKIYSGQLVAIAIICLLTYINTKGVKEAKWIQKLFTTTKLLALFGLIIFGFILVKESYWNQNFATGLQAMKNLGAKDANGVLQPTQWVALVGSSLVGAIATAMVGSVFSSDAWNNVTFIAAEVKNASRNLGLSLFLGTLIVILIYIATNLMYLNVMPLQELAFCKDDRVAVLAANKIFPNIGTTIIAVCIMISTFGCNNGLILSGARVYYTMANDNLFFKQVGVLNKNAVPQVALWVQCIVCSAWCLSGKYGDLLDMISFVVVMFYILTIIGLFILRKTQPNMPRPYKAFDYPFLPIVYIILGLGFCILLIIYKPEYTWTGLLITLIGVPVYYVMKAINKSA